MAKQNEIDGDELLQQIAEREAKEKAETIAYIKSVIELLFVPCMDLGESDDQIMHADLYMRLKAECAIAFPVAYMIESLNDLRYVRKAIDGESFWLVKFA